MRTKQSEIVNGYMQAMTDQTLPRVVQLEWQTRRRSRRASLHPDDSHCCRRTWHQSHTGHQESIRSTDACHTGPHGNSILPYGSVHSSDKANHFRTVQQVRETRRSMQRRSCSWRKDLPRQPEEKTHIHLCLDGTTKQGTEAFQAVRQFQKDGFWDCWRRQTRQPLRPTRGWPRRSSAKLRVDGHGFLTIRLDG